jgi:hypothetical protein
LRSGYESFHTQIASDHRGYFVDFALAGFLDRQLPSIFSASSRAVRGTNPSNIKKYVEYLPKECLKLKISAGYTIDNHGQKK